MSVIIPTYRRLHLLRRCLDALERQSSPPYEIIICDDEPSNEVKRHIERERKMSSLQIFYLPVVETQGPAAARNRGAALACGELLAFTDDDCIPAEDWLERAVSHIERSKSGVLTGRVVVPRSAPPTDYESNEAGLETAEFVTANLFVASNLFRAMRGFHEGFGDAWREDSELHFRLLEKGEGISHADDVVVTHPIRPANFGVSLFQQRKARSEALLYKLHPALYREKIGMFAPLPYYCAVAGLVLSLFHTLGVGITTLSWAMIALRRLRSTTKSPAHVVEMLLTSAFLPFFSLYWRARGAVEHRVLFV